MATRLKVSTHAMLSPSSLPLLLLATMVGPAAAGGTHLSASNDYWVSVTAGNDMWTGRLASLAVGETVILLQLPLPLFGVHMWKKGGCMPVKGQSRRRLHVYIGLAER